ncbi:replication factor C large subunit [Methanobrevibacter filiformis]|uniref:Replication factor C large subunit n=1 Tax=Methanobrevibacter filiformis TaxID=55758 RepID=A0A166C3X5_9EURY|nr:replication factor C large subunit [Methanobrevibacter filiformis]KZX14103.1 holliday junction ATP-dependent DNA helicase RuvB [Methanobrevibacter filiformis]
MLWTEKYRPKSFKEVIGNAKQKKQVEEWVEQWQNNEPQPCLLLIGPAGTGKTSLAHIIAKEFSEYIELNASDKRSYDIIMNTIGESSSTQSLFGNSHKLIILDEIDGIHGTDDRGGTRAIGKIIKESKHPMIMMANDFYSKRLTSIKPKCLVIKINKVHTNSMNALLRKIAHTEGIQTDPEAIKALAKQSNGDMRSAINTLQVVVGSANRLTLEDLNHINKKDPRSTIFDGVGRVLKSKTFKNIKEAMRLEEDPTLVMEYIAENIPREYEKKHEIKKAYQMISKADLYFGRARSSRNYTYWRYASDFMGLGVSLAKDETYKKFTKMTGSMAFSLMGKSRGKRALRDRIAEKMSEKLHISQSIAISMFSQLEIIFQNDTMAYEIADYIGLDDEEIKRFRKKKIPKKVITAMEKKKAEIRKQKKENRNANIADNLFNPTNNKTKNKPSEEKGKKEEKKEINEEVKPTNENKEKQKKTNKNKTTEKNKGQRSLFDVDKKKNPEKKETPVRDKGQTSLFNF